MKIQDNSASYPNYTLEQLNEELNALNQAKQTAMTTGTGTEGVDNLIEKLASEISKRNIGITGDGSGSPSEQAVDPFAGGPSPTPEEQALWASIPKQHASELEDEKTSLDSPKSDEPIDVSNSVQAQQRAEELIRKIDPQYTGNFAVNEIPEVGHLVWQEVRGGNSIIVGNDGGILFFNSSVSPEDGIQAYKDGRRTSEDKFTSLD